MSLRETAEFLFLLQYSHTHENKDNSIFDTSLHHTGNERKGRNMIRNF